MGLIKLVTGIDIEDASVVNRLKEEIDRSNFLYVTATLNIKELRQESLNDNVIAYTKKEKKAFNLYTFTELQRDILDDIYGSGNYLSTSDQKFILSEIIKFRYQNNPHLAIALEDMKHELFELFNFLLFYNVKEISKDKLDLIERDYSYIQKIIFDLFNDFRHMVRDIIPNNQHELSKDEELVKLAEEIISNLELSGGITTIQDRLKKEIDNRVSEIDKLFLDGFLFFDDMQKYLLKSAVEQGKEVYIVAKYSISDRTNSFLLEDNYLRLGQELGQEIEIPYYEEDFDFNTERAIDYLQVKYPEIEMRISSDIKNKILDGTIKILRPFSSRDEELYNVAHQIGEGIRKSNFSSTEEIIEAINKDYAIVVAVDKEKYEERFSQIFEEVGVFILKKDLLKDITSEIDCSTLPEVYYSKKDYLQDRLNYRDGNEVPYDQKYRLFKKLYKNIEIHRRPRPISTYPVGQYIFQIYNIAVEGMSVLAFKMILYSNWKYVCEHMPITDVNKWDKYIGDFTIIETYFEDKKSIDEWLETLDSILLLKKTMDGNELYKWHPFNHIDEASIKFLYGFLDDLRDVIISIKNVNGNIKEHIRLLKEVVMRSDTILAIDDTDLNLEIKVIKKLEEAVKNIGEKSLVKGMTTNYFAENLRGMLKDWEEERLEEEETNDLKINIVNLENMKKYKHVFFIMLESDKYPRKYEESFPFSKEILEILKNPKYGIERKPAQIHGLDYHLRLEQYLFKNVLDFTTDELIISYTEKEDNQINKPSIYIEDIASIFDCDIEELFTSVEITENKAYEIDNKKFKPINVSKKEVYTLFDIGTYLLCPRLFAMMNMRENWKDITYRGRFQLLLFAEALLYGKVMDSFERYNSINKKYYSVHENEYYFVIKDLLDSAAKGLKPYFSFMSEYELKDIKNKVLKKMIQFIKSSVIGYGGFNIFTVRKIKKDPIDLSNGSKLQLYNNTCIYGINNSGRDILQTQTDLYLEFLMLKTNDWSDESKNMNVDNVDGIIRLLKEDNDEDIDRINYVVKLIGKLNYSLSHGNRRHLQAVTDLIDEMERTNYFDRIDPLILDKNSIILPIS